MSIAHRVRDKIKRTLRDRWLMHNVLDMICEPIGTWRVCKRSYGMEINLCDLPLSDGNFNRYSLCHYNSVLSVCALFRITRFIFRRHVAILYCAHHFSYRYLVSQIRVKTFYISPCVESGTQVPYTFDEYSVTRRLNHTTFKRARKELLS